MLDVEQVLQVDPRPAWHAAPPTPFVCGYNFLLHNFTCSYETHIYIDP